MKQLTTLQYDATMASIRLNQVRHFAASSERQARGESKAELQLEVQRCQCGAQWSSAELFQWP